MIIEKIQKNKLYLSTDEIMDVTPLIRQKYSLKVNDNIESLYDEISYEASLEKGIFLLSLRDRTKKELQQKLNEKYRNSRMVEKSVLKLVELGYINDKEYAVSYIISRKYGKQRIAYNLMQKGIGKEIIEEAYFSIEEEYERNIEDEKLEKAIEKITVSFEQQELKNIKKLDTYTHLEGIYSPKRRTHNRANYSGKAYWNCKKCGQVNGDNKECLYCKEPNVKWVRAFD